MNTVRSNGITRTARKKKTPRYGKPCGKPRPACSRPATAWSEWARCPATGRRISSRCQGGVGGGRGRRRHAAVQQVIDEFAHRTNGIAERQLGRATEEQASVDFSPDGGSQLEVDAELPEPGDAVAQAALGQAVHALGAAAWIGPGMFLQALFLAQVAGQPWGRDGTRGQAGHADEFFQLRGVGIDQDLLEVAV